MAEASKPNVSNSSISNSTKEFLESNSLIAKIAFLILVIFVFVILLKLGIALIGYFMQPSPTPHLITGTIDGTNQMVIPQDPQVKHSKTILRSVNKKGGIEFSWSIWLLITSDSIGGTDYKHIFSKGNNNTNYCINSECIQGIFYPNNSPGMYLSPTKNELLILMNTYDEINNTIYIPDIPLNKWFNVIITCENRQVDVYINGFVTASQVLNGIPKQNYGDVYIGGANLLGQISNLWYWNYAITINEIQTIMSDGPNLKLVNNQSSSSNDLNYLSLRWYFYGIKDGYNP
jgi:hypothetical protein